MPVNWLTRQLIEWIHQDGVLKERTTYEIINPEEVGVPVSEIILSARSGRAGLRHHLESIGYHLASETLEEVYQRFLVAADKKKTVDSRDLEALVAGQAPSLFQDTYKLVRVQGSCGNQLIPTATVELQGPNGKISRDSDHGAGPVSAVYRAINRVIREPNKLIEFSVAAITEGLDAVVLLRRGSPVARIVFDQATLLPVRRESLVGDRVTIRYSDYEQMGGVWWPGQTVVEAGDLVLEASVSDLEPNPELVPAVFEMRLPAGVEIEER